MDKRSFLKTASLAGIGTTLKGSDWAAWLKQIPLASPGTSVTDEKYWKEIRGLYKLKPDYINLENGYYNFTPQPILEKYIEHIRYVNREGSYYMRTVQFDNKKRNKDDELEMVLQDAPIIYRYDEKYICKK